MFCLKKDKVYFYISDCIQAKVLTQQAYMLKFRHEKNILWAVDYGKQDADSSSENIPTHILFFYLPFLPHVQPQTLCPCKHPTCYDSSPDIITGPAQFIYRLFFLILETTLIYNPKFWLHASNLQTIAICHYQLKSFRGNHFFFFFLVIVTLALTLVTPNFCLYANNPHTFLLLDIISESLFERLLFHY